MISKLEIKINVFSFILLYVLVVIDGALSNLLHSAPFLQANHVYWLLTLVGITLLTFSLNFNFLWSAIFAGLIEDIFFSGIIGINTISFAVSYLFLRYLADLLPHNYIYTIMSFFLTLTLFSTVSYFFNSYLGLIDTSVLDFISNDLPSTLFMNIILYIVFFIPLSSIINYFKRRWELTDNEQAKKIRR